MGHVEAFRKIEEFEKRNDIWSYRIDDVLIWPLIKFDIFNWLGRARVKNFKQEFSASFKTFSLGSLFKSFLFIYKKDNIKTACFSFSGVRKLYKNTFFDSLFDMDMEGNHDKYIFEWPTANKHHKNNYTAEDRLEFLDCLFLLIKIKSTLFRKKIKINFLRDLIDLVNDEAWLEKLVTTKYKYFIVTKKIFIKILTRKNIKKVYINNNYFIAHNALSAACRELNIPVTELQHGIISPYHPAYFYAQKPDLESKKSNYWPLPDKLEVFGPYFKEIISRGNLFEKDQIGIISRNFIKKIKEEQQNKNTIMKMANIRENDQQKKKIVFTSQWLNRHELKGFVLNLVKKLPKDYILLLKTHPLEEDAQTFYQELISHNNFYLFTDKEISIYDLFSLSDIHSTIFSTCVYESLLWGIPNILLKTEDSENIKELEREEAIFFVKTAEEFIEKTKIIDQKADYFKQAAINLSKFYFS